MGRKPGRTRRPTRVVAAACRSRVENPRPSCWRGGAFLVRASSGIQMDGAANVLKLFLHRHSHQQTASVAAKTKSTSTAKHQHLVDICGFSARHHLSVLGPSFTAGPEIFFVLLSISFWWLVFWSFDYYSGWFHLLDAWAYGRGSWRRRSWGLAPVGLRKSVALDPPRLESCRAVVESGTAGPFPDKGSREGFDQGGWAGVVFGECGYLSDRTRAPWTRS
ncbi:hypothetical protein HDK90DRAFT_115068 [Phyllosticta capitalensis]|uniref:Uncharacterized protein n=1 Tax=Phyllosticta capitalensis TaxID=121624 RepID=A0ABR1Y997_9PEZI